jgi:ribosome maturation factor RimP
MVDLFALTQEALAGMEIELLDVERAPLGLLRVIIDRPEGVRLLDCEQVSRQLSRVYDVENIDYKRLEVSSPGVDRPLRREVDLHHYSGQRVAVKLRQAVEGQRVFSGTLIAPDSMGQETGQAVFSVQFEAKKDDTRVVNFIFADVEYAKLDPVLNFKGKQ